MLTVHFAGIPPGTSALLKKFVPPETLDQFGGEHAFVAAIDASLDQLAMYVADSDAMRALLLGAPQPITASPASKPGGFRRLNKSDFRCRAGRVEAFETKA